MGEAIITFDKFSCNKKVESQHLIKEQYVTFDLLHWNSVTDLYGHCIALWRN